MELVSQVLWKPSLNYVAKDIGHGFSYTLKYLSTMRPQLIPYYCVCVCVCACVCVHACVYLCVIQCKLIYVDELDK